MFCENCGNVVDLSIGTCRYCGATIRSTQNQNNLIGFSARINDPAFQAYKNKSKAWSLLFASILAMIAVIGFPVYGNISGELEFPNSLYYGLGIGGMFILIALVQTLKRGFDKTWDGIVADKKSYKRQVNDNNNDSSYNRYEMVYEVKIKKNSGGTKKHKMVNLPGVYDYYNKGEAVRHHKGFEYYEKYDKTHDTQIMCAACLTFNDINADRCVRCKCPLLK